jgi:putative selenium metabolism hydrolase
MLTLPIDVKVLEKISAGVERRKDEIIGFLREFLMTPSPSMAEKEAIELMKMKMSEVGFDEAKIDDVGNAIGILKGKGNGITLLYNGHVDHVPPGDMKEPYSAKIIDGYEFGVKGTVVYGRGASDMKGALSAMIMACAVLKDMNIKLKGDLIVTGVVQEESGGHVGTKAIIEKDGFKPNAVLLGEATNLDIALGHRGTIWTKITTRGKSCHTSAPERGVNALYKMCKFINEVQKAASTLPEHPVLGKSVMAVTNISVSPGVTNVVPDECTIHIDTRNTPNFTSEKVIKKLMHIINKLSKEDPEFRAEVEYLEREQTSYTGHTEITRGIMLPFYTHPNTPIALIAKESVEVVSGKNPQFTTWKFGTDGSYFANIGIPTIGFGPGEERFAHTMLDHIKIDDVLTSTKVYAVIAADACGISCHG